MSVLIAYGSKREGTAGLAGMLAEALRSRGLQVEVRPARDVDSVVGYEAVIVGGALYAGRWHRDAIRFAKKNARDLNGRPVWFFSSGPLDDSATKEEIPPVPRVQGLMDRVGARGHVTFGGRLTPDAQGFPASAMAKTKAGDWRDPDQVGDWAKSIADVLAVLPS